MNMKERIKLMEEESEKFFRSPKYLKVLEECGCKVCKEALIKYGEKK